MRRLVDQAPAPLRVAAKPAGSTNSEASQASNSGCVGASPRRPKSPGVPTNPRYPVQWRFGKPDALDVRGSNPMGPIVTARFPHEQEIYVHVDGIDSNRFFVRFN